MKAFRRLLDPLQGYGVVKRLWAELRPLMEAGQQFELIARPLRRTLDQNAAQWPILEAFSKQLKWPVNGVMVDLTPEEFKDVLTAAFRGDSVRLAAGLNGGVVMLGMRTSKMDKAQFSEYLEFLHATAALRGVVVYPEPERLAA